MTESDAAGNCANGGVTLTATNGTGYVCNGAAGPQGPAGPPGTGGSVSQFMGKSQDGNTLDNSSTDILDPEGWSTPAAVTTGYPPAQGPLTEPYMTWSALPATAGNLDVQIQPALVGNDSWTFSLDVIVPGSGHTPNQVNSVSCTITGSSTPAAMSSCTNTSDTAAIPAGAVLTFVSVPNGVPSNQSPNVHFGWTATS